MTAALELAGLGIPVDLVEREGELGGQWRHIRYQADGSDPQADLQELIAQVEAEERITVHLGAELRALGAGQATTGRSLRKTGKSRPSSTGCWWWPRVASRRRRRNTSTARIRGC